MIVRDATEADLPRILEITNEAIRNTTSVWTLSPATLEARRSWFNERRAAGFPVLVAEDQGAVLGFASFGSFRPWEGYLHTVEHSIYVDAAVRGRGIGKALLAELIARAQALGKHAMVGGIEAGNTVSVGLHARFGFVESGRLPQVGRKFDRWLDLLFMVRLLN
jgi:phosphinothricin acetyltransferase